jgi:hypothetical protein
MMADGEKNGIWGQITNRNLGQLLEQALYATTQVVMVDADYTLASVYGDVEGDESRSAILVVTGALTADRTILAPAQPKIYYVRNQTTGGKNVKIGVAGGDLVTIPMGFSTLVLIDGADAWDLHSHINVTGALRVENLNVTGDLTVADDVTVGGDQTIAGALTVTGAITGNLTGDVTGDLTGTASLAVDSEHLDGKTLAEIEAEIAVDYNAAIAAAIDALPDPGTPTRASIISSIDTSDVTKKGFKDVAIAHFVYPENGTYPVFDLTGSGITAEQISLTDTMGTGPGTIVGSFASGVYSVTIVGAGDASRNFRSVLWFWRTLGP